MSTSQRRDESLDVANEVDIVCDRFEKTLRAGKSDSAATWIDSADVKIKSTIVSELLLVEWECRPSQDLWGWIEAHKARYPEFRAEIRLVECILAASIETDTSRPLAAGSSFGRFTLTSLLGVGSSSEVWLANDRDLGRDVAIKTPLEHAKSLSQIRRFIREARVTCLLDHPGIVRVYDVESCRGALGIVSEYVLGETLRTTLLEDQPTFRQAADLCSKIADALQHAHDKGIVHRDLKPSNVIVDRQGEPRLTDFGLAKFTDGQRLTLTGDMVGTPAYMAPEQADGRTSAIDGRADIYALGVVLFEMLTGRRPFVGASVSAVLDAIVNHETPQLRTLRRQIPKDLETVCMKALAKEPRSRYATARDMADDLRRFSRGRAVVARRASLPERAWRFLRRHRIATLTTTFMAVAACSVGFTFSLAKENRRLTGVQRVTLRTTPPGAAVALVPVDQVAGGSVASPEGCVIRPRGTTPVSFDAPAGEYHIEVAFSSQRFVEVVRRIPDLRTEGLPSARPNGRWRLLPSSVWGSPQIAIDIDIGTAIENLDRLDEMVVVAIPDRFRRDNPSLPERILVDADEVTLNDASKGVMFEDAINALEAKGKRLPTLQEYQCLLAITSGAESLRHADSEHHMIRDLKSGLAEWTSTRANPLLDSAIVRDHHALGPGIPWMDELYAAILGDSSPLSSYEEQGFIPISRAARPAHVTYRGVRSFTPRFLSEAALPVNSVRSSLAGARR